MRSSKSRSRGNKNRNNRPSGGNIVNRVFDSSGPDGKVRGTPQQIIDKYTQLHRDAQLAGDRVAAENFAQHAEHYLRMLAEAQREIDKQREEQEEQNRQRQADRDRERAQRLKAQEEQANQPGGFHGAEDGERDDSGLVETPENRGDRGEPRGQAQDVPDREPAPAAEKPEGEKPKRPRRSRKKPADSGDGGSGESGSGEARQTAAE